MIQKTITKETADHILKKRIDSCKYVEEYIDLVKNSDQPICLTLSIAISDLYAVRFVVLETHSEYHERTSIFCGTLSKTWVFHYLLTEQDKVFCKFNETHLGTIRLFVEK